MRTIIVDDEAIMLKSFSRHAKGIPELEIVGAFQEPTEALEFTSQNPVDLACMDISMPGMTGLELAKELRKLNPKILIVFISAYEQYIREANQLDADGYIVKPYQKETLEKMAERMQILSRRLKKNLYIQTFGRFILLKDNVPVPLSGKAKEILALVVSLRGKEISNEELYSTLWEGRPYGNVEMKVYYNALRRLRDALAEQDLSALLNSTTRGQRVNTDLFDCDYYEWLDHKSGQSTFQGEFLPEYSWSRPILSDILQREQTSSKQKSSRKST